MEEMTGAALAASGTTPATAGVDGYRDRGAGMMGHAGGISRAGTTARIGATDPTGMTAGIIAILGTTAAGTIRVGITAAAGIIAAGITADSNWTLHAD